MMKPKKSQYIMLTRKAMEDIFDECNRLYFDNSIERPMKFETWTPYKKVLGMVRPCLTPKGKKVHSILHISRRYRWTRENLRKVVAHEMIHLAIEDYKRPLTFLQRLPLIGWFFINQHDDDFIYYMNQLNSKYDLGVTVRFPAMKKEFIR